MLVGTDQFRLSWISIVATVIFLVSVVTGLIMTHQGVADGFFHPYSLGRITLLVLVLIALIYLCVLLRGTKSLESYFWRYALFGMILNTAGSIISSLVTSSSLYAPILSVISNIFFIITYIYLNTALIVEIIHLNTKEPSKINPVKVLLSPLLVSILALIVLLILHWILPSDFTSNLKNITIVSSYIFIVFDIVTLILSTILLVSSYTSDLFGIYGSLSFAMLILSSYHIINLFTNLYDSPLPIHFNILRIVTMFLLLIAIDGRMNLSKHANRSQPKGIPVE